VKPQQDMPAHLVGAAHGLLPVRGLHGQHGLEDCLGDPLLVEGYEGLVDKTGGWIMSKGSERRKA
jgi:hypothetical protein